MGRYYSHILSTTEHWLTKLFPAMNNSPQHNSPPGFRPRPRPLLQSSSPLNPNHADLDTKPASAHPITSSNLRRMSSTSPYSYSRRGSTPGTPNQRYSPRSPLSYLSPSLSGLSTSSSLSIDGWPLTPQSPLSQLPMLPSPTLKSNSPPISSRLSVSIDEIDHRPAYIKRRHDLDELPASPPIVNPAYLLEHHPKPSKSADHSIASPFLNADTSPALAKRRPSALAHEIVHSPQ